jgi:DNA-binding MarR family transcriptional regulator
MKRAAADAPADLVCACAGARQVARLVTQRYDQHLRNSGIEAPQFALLMALQKEGPSSQIALGRRYGLDKTTVSRNLKWLERRGWITSSAAADARQRQFTLTADGRKRLNLALPHWQKAQAELRLEIGAAQWDGMFRAFQAVTRAAHTARELPR